MNYKTITTILLIGVMMIACKEKKKKSMKGDEPVMVSDFVSFYDKKNLPFEISDTALAHKDNDSSKISYKIFKQFVPDSAFTRIMGKGSPAIYPIARFEAESKEIYLLTKTIVSGKRAALVIVLDKDSKFAAIMPLLITDKLNNTQQVSSIDNKFTISKNVIRTNTDNSISEGKDVFVFNNDAHAFTLIMTDPLDETAAELINPIDTVERKNKYSADYVKDKKNIVSIRDGNRDGKLLFFIHMEKDNGQCNGELKGDASFTSATTAVYRQPGDPCGVQFTFSSSGVSVKELEGCGNHRDMRCSFDGNYPKKKQPRSSKNTKAKSK